MMCAARRTLHTIFQPIYISYRKGEPHNGFSWRGRSATLTTEHGSDLCWSKLSTFEPTSATRNAEADMNRKDATESALRVARLSGKTTANHHRDPSKRTLRKVRRWAESSEDQNHFHKRRQVEVIQ